MEKEVFGKAFLDSLNKNFQTRSKYFDFNFYVFSELGGTIFEINKCLILEFHRASITLTNNLLERLLKLSLIYEEVGIGAKPVDTWSSTFEEPNKKFSVISLGSSIERCKKLNLITEHEKVFLFDTIREVMRNGFSHADSTKVLTDIPDEINLFQSSFENPKEIKQLAVNQKAIPFIQSMHIEAFAKENASNYFDYVFELIKKIDQRLIERDSRISI